MANIENIIFDLGNVIINIDLQRTVRAFAQLTSVSFDRLQAELLQTSFFHDFETGRLDNLGFRAGIRDWLQQDLPDSAIDQAWNALLLDIPAARRALLKNLRTQFRTFVLSNTNDLHVQAIEAQLGEESLQHWFERVYYSHDMGLRKPDPVIYAQVLEENQLLPQNTLFLDDNPQNVATARQLGLHTIHILPGQTDMIQHFEPNAFGQYRIVF
ncbi:MAG: HAD family phosphatase [Microscillaceae bacterium]